MSEEIRRSGRATKGQHTKNSDDDAPPAPAPAKTMTLKQAAKNKSKSGKREPTPEQVEDAEDEATIRCVCGINDDDYEGTMVCCETCEAWQHNLCMGISEDEEDLPDKYWCEQCKPENHVELLAAMKRGEKPWDERKKRKAEEERLKKQEEERLKRQKKGKRKSRPSAVEDTKSTPAPSEPPTNKRKFEEVSQGQSAQPTASKSPTNLSSKKQPSSSTSSPTVLVPATSQRRKPSAVTNEAKRRKSGVEESKSATPPVGNIADLAIPRQITAKALAKEIKSLVEQASKNGIYRIPDGETASTSSQRHALLIEHALVVAHKENTQGYTTQARAISFNIKKNAQLLLRVLSGSLSALELAEMSTDDMASEELQRERAQIKEEADKQAILISEQTGPRIRKTHKGDEIVEEEAAAESNYQPAPVRRRETIDEDAAATPPERESSPHMVELPDDVGKPPLSVDTAASNARRQSNIDMKEVWKHAHSPTGAPPLSASRRSTGADFDDASRENAIQDADVDRLLKDEDMDDAPSSPAADGSWRGRIDMAGVATFRGSARWVAGGDIAIKSMAFNRILPRTLAISGRIQVQRADEYMSGMRYSHTSDVCALAITPHHTQADTDGFAAIFEYFHTKGRWAVIPPEGGDTPVRDLYLVPLQAGQSAGFPSFLSMLQDREMEEPCRENMLLLTLVIKTRSPPPSATTTPSIPQQNQMNPAYSPTVSQTTTTGINGNGVSNGNGVTPLSAVVGAPPPPANATPLAVKHLGPFINTTVVKQILEAVPDMNETQLINLRDVLDKEPSTREDIGKLGEHLNRRNGGVVA